MGSTLVEAHISCACSLAGELPGLGGLGPSYLSMDTDGRVIRLDSVAKVCSAAAAQFVLTIILQRMLSTHQ